MIARFNPMLIIMLLAGGCADGSAVPKLEAGTTTAGAIRPLEIPQAVKFFSTSSSFTEGSYQNAVCTLNQSKPFILSRGMIFYYLNGAANFRTPLEPSGRFSQTKTLSGSGGSTDAISFEGAYDGEKITARTRCTQRADSCDISYLATLIKTGLVDARKFDGRYIGTTSLIRDFGPINPSRQQNGGCVGPGGIKKTFVVADGVVGFPFNSANYIASAIQSDEKVNWEDAIGWHMTVEFTEDGLHAVIHTSECELEWDAKRTTQ